MNANEVANVYVGEDVNDDIAIATTTMVAMVLVATGDGNISDLYSERTKKEHCLFNDI